MAEAKLLKQAGTGVPDFLRRAIRQGVLCWQCQRALLFPALASVRCAAGIGVGIAVVLGCAAAPCPSLTRLQSRAGPARRYLIEDPLEVGLHSDRAGDQWLQGCKWAVRTLGLAPCACTETHSCAMA